MKWGLPQTNQKNAAESKFLIPGDVEPPDDRDREKEDPEIRDQVGNVGKVAKCNQVEALAGYQRIPEFRNGPAIKRQDNGDG